MKQIYSFFFCKLIVVTIEAVCFFARLDALGLPMRIRFVILDILFFPAACRTPPGASDYPLPPALVLSRRPTG